MTFFVPTDEELKKAGAVKATYNDNQRYTFLCEKVTVKDRDDGQLYVLTCKIVGSENDGVEEPLFYNLGKSGGMRAFCELSATVLDATERTRETFQPSLFVGRKWSAKAYNNGNFVNWTDYVSEGAGNGVPTLGSTDVEHDNVVPF